jgi:hypothetical protein
MPTRIADHPYLRPVPNACSGQPGGPTDELVLGFEGSLQGLIVEIDDAKVIDLALSMMQRPLNELAIDAKNAAATNGASRDVQNRIQCNTKRLADIMDALRERSARLNGYIIPDQQSIVRSLDTFLTNRSKERRGRA